MKTLKRILSAVASAALAVSSLVPLTASAAPTGSITINLPDSVDLPQPKIATIATVSKDKLAKMGFEAYRVLDRDPDTIPSEGEDNNKVYTVNADFYDFFKNITPTAYENSIHDEYVWLTVDENENLKLVPDTEDTLPEDVIMLPVNETVTANSADVLAGVLLSEIETDSAKASDAQRLANWLKAYAEKNKGDFKQDGVIASYENGAININNLEYGYWLVYSTKAAAGVSNVKVVLEVGEGNQATINVKAEDDGLAKTVRNMTDEDGTYEKNAQADVGDILEYKVEFDIQPLDEYPTNDGSTYTEFKYIFSDMMTNQRLVNYLNTSTTVSGTVEKQGAFLVKVTVNGNTRYYVDLATDDITPNLKKNLGLPTTANVQPLTNIRKEEVGGINYGKYEDGEQTFTIDFNWSSLKTLVGEFGAQVTFMYKAELTSNAVLQNNNQVTLNYSNNPNDQSEDTTNTDTTTVYSYGLDITKTFAGVKGEANLWESVVFNLYEASLTNGEAPKGIDEGERIAFIEKEGTQGDYKRADSVDIAGGNSSYDLKLKTTDNTMNIYGLAPGYYVLEETGSPNGYLLGGKVYIYIDEEGNILRSDRSKLWLGEEDISKGSITGTDTNSTKDSLLITIDNQKRDFDLPETGGMGVWLCGIGGILVLAGAVYVYSSLRKKNII